MKPVFISYRRGDSAVFTGRVYDRLASAFGTEAVFLDIDSIPSGVADYRTVVQRYIDGSGLVLAIIGKSWTGQRLDGARRIDESNDPVRVELERALALNKPIIPLYFDTDEPLSISDLPASLASIAWINAAFVTTGPDFDQQIKRLQRRMEHILWPSKPLRSAHRLSRFLHHHRTWLAGMATALVVAFSCRGWLASRLISANGVVHALGTVDRHVFGGADPTACDIIRAFPDRESLVDNTDLSSTIAETLSTFDLFALSAGAFYSNPEALRKALRNNVVFRIVLMDTGEASRVHLATYFSACSQGGSGMQWQIDSTNAAIAAFKSIASEATNAGKGRLLIRTWTGPFQNSMWIRDGYLDDGLAHVELTYYGQANWDPSLRVGVLGSKMRQSLQAQFEYIWEHAVPAK